MNGFYRRIHIIPFENKFDVGNKKFDSSIYYKQENLDYLGNLGLRAYIKLLESGSLTFSNEAESQTKVAEYKKLNDTIYLFLTEQKDPCIYNVDVKSTDLYSYYRDMCYSYSLNAVGKQSFYTELKNRFGFTKKTINGYVYFYREIPVT